MLCYALPLRSRQCSTCFPPHGSSLTEEVSRKIADKRAEEGKVLQVFSACLPVCVQLFSFPSPPPNYLQNGGKEGSRKAARSAGVLRVRGRWF